MPVVYVYRGTFDPFHNNHEAICRWCLDQHNVASLIIHINYKPPSETNKKNAGLWENRFDLVKAALNGLATVSPEKEFQDTLAWITSHNGPDTQIIQVLGDDVLDLLKDAPQIHSYAIHQRKKPNAIESTTPLFDKIRYNIPLTLPNISSTKIRLLLIEVNIEEVAKMVPSSILHALQTMADYSSLQLSIRLLRQKNIFISPAFSQKLLSFFKQPIYLKYEPEKFSGLSGDALVSVFSLEKKRIAVCKLFKQGEDACLKELSGYERLGTVVKTPKIYFVCEHGFCIEFISGRNAQSADDFERIGLAYHELHMRSMLTDGQTEQKKDSSLDSKISTLSNKIPNTFLSRTIKIVFEELLETYLNTPRDSSITHGDTQPGNTLLTEDNVIFIDASEANEWSDASRDVHQMMASIYWKAYKNKATDDVETIKNNIAAFCRGYGHIPDTPASKLWSLYWRTRSLLLALETPTVPLSKHIISSFKMDFPKLALYIRDHSENISSCSGHPYFFGRNPQDICQPCNQQTAEATQLDL